MSDPKTKARSAPRTSRAAKRVRTNSGHVIQLSIQDVSSSNSSSNSSSKGALPELPEELKPLIHRLVHWGVDNWVLYGWIESARSQSVDRMSIYFPRQRLVLLRSLISTLGRAPSASPSNSLNAPQTPEKTQSQIPVGGPAITCTCGRFFTGKTPERNFLNHAEKSCKHRHAVFENNEVVSEDDKILNEKDKIVEKAAFFCGLCDSAEMFASQKEWAKHVVTTDHHNRNHHNKDEMIRKLLTQTQFADHWSAFQSKKYEQKRRQQEGNCTFSTEVTQWRVKAHDGLLRDLECFCFTPDQPHRFQSSLEEILTECWKQKKADRNQPAYQLMDDVIGPPESPFIGPHSATAAPESLLTNQVRMPPPFVEVPPNMNDIPGSFLPNSSNPSLTDLGGEFLFDMACGSEFPGDANQGSLETFDHVNLGDYMLRNDSGQDLQKHDQNDYPIRQSYPRTIPNSVPNVANNTINPAHLMQRIQNEQSGHYNNRQSGQYNNRQSDQYNRQTPQGSMAPQY